MVGGTGVRAVTEASRNALSSIWYFPVQAFPSLPWYTFKVGQWGPLSQRLKLGPNGMETLRKKVVCPLGCEGLDWYSVRGPL